MRSVLTTMEECKSKMLKFSIIRTSCVSPSDFCEPSAKIYRPATRENYNVVKYHNSGEKFYECQMLFKLVLKNTWYLETMWYTNEDSESGL